MIRDARSTSSLASTDPWPPMRETITPFADGTQIRCFVAHLASRQTIEVSPEDIRKHLREECHLWLDIQRIRPEHDAWLTAVFGLHPLATEDLHIEEVLPKVERYDGTLFTVCDAIDWPSAQQPIGTINLNLFLAGRWLVTTHAKPLPFVEHLHDRLLKGADLLAQGADVVYHALLDGVVDGYFPALDRIDEALERIERRIFARFDRGVQQEIFETRKRLLTLRRYVGPHRDVVTALLAYEGDAIRPETRLHLRDVLDHTLRVLDATERYRDLLNGAMECYLSAISQRTNEIMKTLSIVATILLPLSFIAGLYGMNFAWMPGLHHPQGFWFVVAVMAMLAAGLLLFFRRRGWL